MTAAPPSGAPDGADKRPPIPLATAAHAYWCARLRLVGRMAEDRLAWTTASLAMLTLSADPRPTIAARAIDALADVLPPCDGAP